MSRSNREKRAAKARARRAGSPPGPGGRTTPPGRDPAGPSAANRSTGGRPDGHEHHDAAGRWSADELLDHLVQLTYRGDGGMVRTTVVSEIAADVVGFRRELATRLCRLVAGLWTKGWQPVEAVRHVRRGCGPAAVRLALAAIAVDRQGRDDSSLDPRWSAQLATLDLPPLDDEGGGARAGSARADVDWVRRWMSSEAATTDEAVLAAADLLVRLMTMPPIEALIAPPGASADWRARVVGSSDVGASAAAVDPVLERVRALLAKAESSSFEAEAESFTAKAQELIARHAIDTALLADGDDDGPSAVRVFIDDPYGDAKSLLLQVVAASGRCRSVFLGSLGMSSVVGHPADLAAVELMFTSLLVQAQTAMATAARSAPPGARTRSRGYRSAFLQSYASRIGQRLDEINEAVVAESEIEAGTSILPVLASRDAEVQRTVDELFGPLTTSSVRGGYDAAGWAGGRFAADNAQLGAGAVGAGDGAAGERR